MTKYNLTNCPHCGAADSVEYDDPGLEVGPDNGAAIATGCSECGATWVYGFKLVDVHFTHRPPEAGHHECLHPGSDLRALANNILGALEVLDSEVPVDASTTELMRQAYNYTILRSDQLRKLKAGPPPVCRGK